MWRTGLRVSEALELEWRDLDYSGEPATLLVRKSKSGRPRTVRLHRELVQLFTNWPANRFPRDKVVALSMRTALRHIGESFGWAGLEVESPGTGQRRPGAHSLRHSAARHWLVSGGVPAERGLAVSGTCQCAGDAANLPADRGQWLWDGCCSVELGGDGGDGLMMASHGSVGPFSLPREKDGPVLEQGSCRHRLASLPASAMVLDDAVQVECSAGCGHWLYSDRGPLECPQLATGKGGASRS